MTSEKWQKLIERLEITTDEGGAEVLDAESLESFENKYNIKLPNDYKEFCQILGTGVLAEQVRICCLTEQYVSNERWFLNDAISKLQKHLENDPSKDPNRDLTFINLLKFALPFGDLCDGDLLLVWDLRTYSRSDDSYDIFCVDCVTPECDDPVFLGRIFFDFVQDFCYTARPSEIFPDIFDLPFSEEDYTFFQFTPR